MQEYHGQAELNVVLESISVYDLRTQMLETA
jgi:hypothetical protein